MKNFLSRFTLFGVVVASSTFAVGSALADSGNDFGKREFDSNCASCHGITGKGDGPLKANLTVAPANLTIIAKNNNGILPVGRLTAVIDGRMEVNSHGPRVMPVWGQDYAAQAGMDWPSHMDVPFNPNVFVRSRIMALLDYIDRLQEK